MKNFVTQYLSDESLDKIGKFIGEIERKTSGEIRLCIKKKRGYVEKNKTPREIALKEFSKLKMDKTKDKTGVLFFLMFDEHKLEIIADTGINDKVNSELWDEISAGVIEQFRKENYLEGILYGIGKIGEVLIREFKVRDDDTDELPNEVIIKE